jgi:hypothetical protein
MTQPVREPSDAGAQAATDFRVRQLARRPPVIASLEPTCFRAAVGPAIRGGTPFDPEAHRQHYLSHDEGNNVYWDQWDTSFDTSVYSVDLYDATLDATEGVVIGGVALLKRGLYSIYAIVDIAQTINGMVALSTNWDQGQGTGAHYVANVGIGGEPYWGDFYAFQIHQWRWLEESNPDTTPPTSFFRDGWFGGDAATVEIVFHCDTSVDDAGVTGANYLNLTPGTPGDDVWIPGGYDGAWGLVPQLFIAYWGDPGLVNGVDPDWPASFGLSVA